MNTEHKYQTSVEKLDSTLHLLCKSGCLEGREDIVLFLIQQGYQVERISGSSISVITPQNEKYCLSGKLYSTGNSKSVNKLQNYLWALFWVCMVAGFVSRFLWMAVFDAITSPAQNEFWLFLPEVVRTDLNMWGYLVPPVFISVALTALVVSILAGIIRIMSMFLNGYLPLKGGK
ncbi:TPA_asm: hypothetical protein GND06_004275 [Salmonella enterica subsp. enterica]|uniref:Uncharacterized protein n=1 Tax=Salmonella enterica subsp. houtenae serovar 44:z4,z24:- TaxID=1967610 RepID=A0A737NVG5_SALHO|nr:hypothetical protein [Salmonella enterica]HAE7714434.1 hypothetical protein [Salmonella enterica subsp. enterica]HAE8353058.1 hypothetical protein [Salmonella enterica subsp. houtenae serovar 44:z4,z24:-]